MDQKLKQTLIDYGKQVVVPLINENAEDAKFTNGESGITSATITDAIKETYSKAVAAQTTADAATAAAAAAHATANTANTTANTAKTNAAAADSKAQKAYDAANAAGTAASNAQVTANSAYEAANSAGTAAAAAQSKADDAYGLANAANTAAHNAQTTADKGVADAATAQAAAESAAAAAASAQTDATQALANAAAAASAAQSAHSAANTAQTTANTAVTNAASAQATANSAVLAAAAAQTRADDAYTLADAANTAAAAAASAAANITVTWDSTNKKIKYTDSSNTAHDVAAFALTKLGTATAGYTATYELTIGGTSIGKVDIPKDYLVKSATVEECTVANVPVEGYEVGDKYIDFVVNSADGTGNVSHIYLLVTELVDVYTGTGAINIDNTNVISFVASAVNVAASGADKGVSATLGGNLGTTTLTIAVTEAANLSSDTNVLTGKGLGDMLPSTTGDFSEIYNAINAANNAATSNA